MRIALYIEDGLEQIVLTPESETEKAILGKLHDGSRDMSIVKGSFYECRGGWVRHRLHEVSTTYGRSETGDDSSMIVLRPAKPQAAGVSVDLPENFKDWPQYSAGYSARDLAHVKNPYADKVEAAIWDHGHADGLAALNADALTHP